MAQASNRSAEQRPLLRDEEADADPSSIDSTTATTKRYAAARTSRYIVFGVSLALIVLLIATGIVVGVRDSRGPPPEDGPEDGQEMAIFTTACGAANKAPLQTFPTTRTSPGPSQV